MQKMEKLISLSGRAFARSAEHSFVITSDSCLCSRYTFVCKLQQPVSVDNIDIQKVQ